MKGLTFVLGAVVGAVAVVAVKKQWEGSEELGKQVAETVESLIKK